MLYVVLRHSILFCYHHLFDYFYPLCCGELITLELNLNNSDEKISKSQRNSDLLRSLLI